jgi:NAD(P)-dependent dehydrogenase (short-subunit alcohol dehydrogenase family)
MSCLPRLAQRRTHQEPIAVLGCVQPLGQALGLRNATVGEIAVEDPAGEGSRQVGDVLAMASPVHDRYGRVINIGSEAGTAIVPGLAAYCVSKHALVALTEVIQDGNHDNGIKAWVICPGFVDTDMGYVVPGASRAAYLAVEEVVGVARFLIRLGDNVKIGPQVLVRTMRNPMATEEAK